MYVEVATHSGWQGEAGRAGAWLFPALLLDTITIQGNDQPHCCGGALCSMGAALVLPPP
jgi:hypothetical protein